jgi:hypothetical protein
LDVAVVDATGSTEGDVVEEEAIGPTPGAVAGELSPVEEHAPNNTSAVIFRATDRAVISMIRR